MNFINFYFFYLFIHSVLLKLQKLPLFSVTKHYPRSEPQQSPPIPKSQRQLAFLLFLKPTSRL